MKQETNNSSRFFITGDCHGDFGKIEFFCRYHETTPDDCMIILGDAGINFCMDHRDEELKNALDKMPLTFLCVHGNHEERPYNISSYRTKVCMEVLFIMKMRILRFYLRKMVKCMK